MKKLLILFLGAIMITGCFEDTDFSDNISLTTIYPIEYITNYLYEDYSTIKSIYPNGVDLEQYSLTDKQKTNYAASDTFVYNGISNEVTLAVDFINTNSKLHIIDAMKNMNYKYGEAELWLDPSHYLMVARNIKESLIDYEENVYRKDDIEKKYEELKIQISEIDVDLTMIGKNASYHTIVVANNTLEYLSKYNITVLSLDENNTNSEKNLNEAKRLATEDDIIYLYKLKDYELPDNISAFAKTYDLEIIEIDSMENLTEEQKKDGANYITIMNENIDNLKKELLK